MKSPRLLLRNSAFQMTALLAKKGAIALTLILIARLAGEIFFGKYVFAYALFSLAALLAAFGLPPLTVRDTARYPDRAPVYFLSFLALRLPLAVLAIGIVTAFTVISRAPWDTGLTVIIMSISLVPACLIDQAQAVYSAFQRMEYVAVTMVAQWGCFLGLSLYILIRWRSLWLLGIGQVVSFSIAAAYAVWLLARRFFPPRSEIDLSLWKYALREALPLAVQTIFGILYFRIGTIMLSLMAGDAAVAWFGGAFHINEALQLIPMSVAAAMLPQVSERIDNAPRARPLSEKVLKYNLIVALPIAAGICAFAPQICSLVYGKRFLQAAPVLRITIWALIPTYLNYVMGTILIGTGRQKVIALNAIICCLISVPLNFLLIRRAGYVGAGLATLVSEFTLLMLNFYFLRRYLGGLAWRTCFLPPFVASAAAGVIVLGLSTWLPYRLLVVLSILVYFALLRWNGAISLREILSEDTA